MNIKTTFFVMSMVEFVDGEEYHNKPTAHKSQQEAEAAMRKKADEWKNVFKEVADFKPIEKPFETPIYKGIEIKDENSPETYIKIWVDKVTLSVEI